MKKTGPVMANTFGPAAVRGSRKSASILPNVVHPTGAHKMSSLAVADRNLIRGTLERQKTQRERVFSQDLPFSWLRMLVGIISILFVLTDVPRSGIRISDLRNYYNMLEPDIAVASSLMPWSYSVFRASKEDADSISARVWSYKFDTTSNVWRAFAQYLNVSAIPQCLLYKTACTTKKLPGNIIFSFIDALVDNIALKSRPVTNGDKWRRPMRPPSIALRTECEYFDRIHDYLLPWLFTTRIWRTNQAIFLPALGIRNSPGDAGKGICFGGLKPMFCQELWINYNRTCSQQADSCREVGHVYTHMMRRLRAIQEQFPNTSVDLTILESAEDLQRSLFTLGTEGYRRFDISTIIRARVCPIDLQQDFNDRIPPPLSPHGENKEECKTVYVDDYRYEIVIMASDVVQWFRFVVSLRLVGQAYFFIRLFALGISCYHALGRRLSKETISERLHKTLHLLSKAPTQCIVFGSAFPIFCYTTAHAADATIMYRMLEDRFVTQNGVLDMSIRSFVGVAVIEMRSVWVYAMLLHIAVRTATWRRWTESSDNVIGGIIGVPEFFLTAMASVNIIALFRSTMFRSSRVMSIMEVTPSGGRLEQVILRLQRFSHIGQGSNHFGGMVIDLKFLLSIILLVIFVAIWRGIYLRVRQRPGDCQTHTLIWPLGRTPVPYSAGILWSTVSLCVHWTSDFFCIHEGASKRTLTLRRAGQSMRISPVSAVATEDWQRHSVEFISGPSIRMNLRVFRSIQHQMESIHDRSSEVEGNVAFMNLVLMSDPIVYFYLRFGDDAQKGLAYFQSLDYRDKVLLLPENVVTIENEPMTRLRILRRVHLRDMHWSELVQCG